MSHATIEANVRVNEERCMAQAGRGDIAIVGMACRFPGARDTSEFWSNLVAGENSICEIPADRWDADEYYSPDHLAPNKSISKWGGFIDGVSEFDAAFFGISPSEAKLMDPQQRLMLELAFNCIEDAGYTRADFDGSRTGVYLGVSSFDYQEMVTAQVPVIEGHMGTGLGHSVIPNRVSHFFNLHGPSMLVDTACSSSLVALNQAVHALRRGDCMAAFAGGINLLLTPTLFISFSMTGMLSPDGQCNAFDEMANGYVRGEGAGLVLLKPLESALRDGDRIRAVVRGSAVNHGGRARTLTSPNAFAQSQVIVEAFSDSGVSPHSVSFIEAHGTGTAQGDPIEIAGLKRAFSQLSKLTGGAPTVYTCGIGSVKTNVGHMEAAAGIGGLIKIVLSLQNKIMPKSLNFGKLNPRINLSGSPFYVVQKNTPWEALKDADGLDLPRRAGVSSFGFGGVNAHVVLEEYIAPVDEPVVPYAPRHSLVVLSGKDETRLKEQAGRLLAALDAGLVQASLDDIAYTLQVGREPMKERLAFVVDTCNQLKESLARYCRDEPVDCYRGNVTAAKSALGMLGADEELQETLVKWGERGKFDWLASLWVNGVTFDWSPLHITRRPQRLSLPTYPFARERYWFDDPAGGGTHIAANDRSSQAAKEPARFVTLPQNWVSALANFSAEARQKQLQQYMTGLVAAVLDVAPETIEPQRPMQEYGLDSVFGMKLMRQLEQTAGVALSGRDLLENPSIDALSRCLSNKMAQSPGLSQTLATPVASQQSLTDALEGYRSGALNINEVKSLIERNLT